MTLTPPDYGVLGELELPLGLGLLRLSTEGRPAEADAIDVIRFALDQGIRILDTADSYALDDRDMHHGERLVCKALAERSWREVVRVFLAAGEPPPSKNLPFRETPWTSANRGF